MFLDVQETSSLEQKKVVILEHGNAEIALRGNELQGKTNGLNNKMYGAPYTIYGSISAQAQSQDCVCGRTQASQARHQVFKNLH